MLLSLTHSRTSFLPRRRMPMERLVWAIIGMAMFRHVPMTQLVNQLDILLPGERPFVVPSAFLQARQKLGDKSIEPLFHETAARWYQPSHHPDWAGLQLLAVDGVMATAGRRWGDVAYPRHRQEHGGIRLCSRCWVGSGDNWICTDLGE